MQLPKRPPLRRKAFRNPRFRRIAHMINVSNPRSTLGKARHLTGFDWQAILTAYNAGKGLIRIEASTGRAVTMTRAEVEFIQAKGWAA
jgi:hypothetical protein